MKETIPFTYKLIFKPTGQYYYGVRWAKGCHPKDLWSIYFTSSKYVKQLIKEYGKDSFEYKVTKTFKNKKDASDWELKLLKKVNAKDNVKFINKSNVTQATDNTGSIWVHHLPTNTQSYHDPSRPIPEGWSTGLLPSHIEKVKKGQLKSNKKWIIITNPETDKEQSHDPNETIPNGWIRGHSKSHIEKNKEAHNKLYESENYRAWNKGLKYTNGPCTDGRRNAIKQARLRTKKIKCEYCSKETDPGNFKQFHGDNCKYNPNIDISILEERSRSAKRSIQTQKETGTFSKPKTPVGIFKCPHCGKKGSNYGNMKRWHYDRCKFKDS